MPICPLYTLPNPPLPMIRASSKLLVATLISAMEKRRHVLDGLGFVSLAEEALFRHRKIRNAIMDSSMKDVAAIEATMGSVVVLFFEVLVGGGGKGLEPPRLYEVTWRAKRWSW